MKTTFLLLLLAIPLASAAPFQPAHIPSEAQWYLHGDVTALRETTTGSNFLKKIRQDEPETLADIENIFGFDLLIDITDITLFGSGREDEAAVILSGKIGRSNLEDVIAQAEDYQTSTFRTFTIHQWADDGKTQHAAFHGDDTVIVSPEKKLIELALDVFSENKPGLGADFTLPSKSPFIVAFANIRKIDMPLDDGSRILRKADSILMTLSEANERLTADMVVQTGTSKTARRLMHVLEGLVSLGELADENIEELDLEHEASTNGKTMTMSMNLPAAKALALLSELK